MWKLDSLKSLFSKPPASNVSGSQFFYFKKGWSDSQLNS